MALVDEDAPLSGLPAHFDDGDSATGRSCGTEEAAGPTPRNPSYALFKVFLTVEEDVECVESEKDSAVVDLPKAVGTQDVWSDNLGRLLAFSWLCSAGAVGVGVTDADEVPGGAERLGTRGQLEECVGANDADADATDFDGR